MSVGHQVRLSLKQSPETLYSDLMDAFRQGNTIFYCIAFLVCLKILESVACLTDLCLYCSACFLLFSRIHFLLLFMCFESCQVFFQQGNLLQTTQDTVIVD